MIAPEMVDLVEYAQKALSSRIEAEGRWLYAPSPGLNEEQILTICCEYRAQPSAYGLWLYTSIHIIKNQRHSHLHLETACVPLLYLSVSTCK